MGNFRHNRGTMAAQAQLLREALGHRHRLCGIYSHTGNYAFSTAEGPETLAVDVMAALNRRFRVMGVVVVSPPVLAQALAALERVASERLGARFDTSYYGASQPDGRWRAGLVLTDVPPSREDVLRQALDELRNGRVAVLTTRDGLVGVLKRDHGRRIPWGVPAGLVGRAIERSGLAIVATGRSGRTARETLRLVWESAELDRASAGDVAPAPLGETQGEPGTRRGVRDPAPAGVKNQEGTDMDDFAPKEAMLRAHKKLRKAGEPMLTAFVELACQVERQWPDREVREAGHREQYVPFSIRGTKNNVADQIRVAQGRIELALKLPADRVGSADPRRRTRPLRPALARNGRFTAYTREFTFEDPQDVPYVVELIGACRPASASSAPSSSPEESSPSAPGPSAEARARPLREAVAPAPTGPGPERSTAARPPSPPAGRFPFVRDAVSRAVLEQDGDEAERARDVGLWKSCVILCGGLVEGLLVDALERRDPKTVRDQMRDVLANWQGRRLDGLRDWDLGMLLEAARRLRLISAPTEKQARALQAVRNLVHPARQARDEVRVDDADARIALETVEKVRRELSARTGPEGPRGS